MEEFCPVLLFFQNTVTAIDADLTACMDGILSFPELDEPGSSGVVEVDRKGIKDHVKTGGGAVIKGSIAEPFLPCIQRGGEEILRLVIGVAEGKDQIFDQSVFLLSGHIADLLNGIFTPEQAEQDAKDAEEQNHSDI